MNNLWKYLKGYEKEAVCAPLFKLLEALMDLIVPLIVASMIDVGIARGDRGYIAARMAMLFGLAAVGLAFSITAQWFSAKASVGFGTKLRQALFDHVQSLSYRELDTIGTDTMITRLTSDINQVQTGLNMGLRLLLRSPFVVLGSCVFAFMIDVKSALVFAVAIPLLGIVIFGIMLVSIPLFRKVQTALDGLLSATRENLTGVRVIRAFRREQDSVAEFDKKNDNLTKLNLFVGRVSALMNPVSYAMINIATIILIYVGAVRVNGGALEQGQVVALYNYMAQMIVELIKLASLIITINKSLACADRVAGVFEMTPSIANGTSEVDVNSDAPVVAFDDVTFTYAGASAPSLEHVSFQALKGQTIGIIGGTGSGKSTLVNLIPRFYDATEGSIKVYGSDIQSVDLNSLLSMTGVVPQKAQLFAGTIRDNMKWGKEDATDAEIWEALETAQATEVVEGKDGQLDFRLEQNGRNLSGGQKQRLTIARALIKKPQILILDDSSSALDFATDAKLRVALHNLSWKLTVFVVSQRAASVMYADDILVLDDGKLVGHGTHDELMKSNEIYQEIYYSQFPREEES